MTANKAHSGHFGAVWYRTLRKRSSLNFGSVNTYSLVVLILRCTRAPGSYIAQGELFVNICWLVYVEPM